MSGHKKWTGYHCPQRSYRKVMLSHLSVILFTRGVSGRHPSKQTPWVDTPTLTNLHKHPLGRHHHHPAQTPPRQTPLGRHPSTDTPKADPLGRHPLGRHPTPLPRRPLQRTVRILLECILVTLCFVLADPQGCHGLVSPCLSNFFHSHTVFETYLAK